jgi:hypothetical protein
LILNPPNPEAYQSRAYAAITDPKSYKDLTIAFPAEGLDDAYVQVTHGNSRTLPGFTGRSMTDGDVCIDPRGVAHMFTYAGWERIN